MLKMMKKKIFTQFFAKLLQWCYCVWFYVFSSGHIVLRSDFMEFWKLLFSVYLIKSFKDFRWKIPKIHTIWKLKMNFYTGPSVTPL